MAHHVGVGEVQPHLARQADLLRHHMRLKEKRCARGFLQDVSCRGEKIEVHLMQLHVGCVQNRACRTWWYWPLLRASMPAAAISLDFMSGFLLKAMPVSDLICSHATQL